MSDQDIQKLESEFPPLSGAAFAAARKQALDAGLSVVESDIRSDKAFNTVAASPLTG